MVSKQNDPWEMTNLAHESENAGVISELYRKRGGLQAEMVDTMDLSGMGIR